MNEEFLATIKLITSEELIAQVSPIDHEKILICNPVFVEKTRNDSGIIFFRVIPWIKTTTSDTFILEKRNIITLSECFDTEIHELFFQYLKGKELYSSGNQRQLTKEDGYIDNVKNMKNKLEKLFKSSSDTKKQD